MTTLTDIGAELEAIAGIGLDDHISRLGGAGYTKGLFMDILKGRVAVPANVSRLSARGRMMALFSTIGPQFYAPRTSSITQTRGSGTPTETRATVATVMGYGPTAVLADGQTLLTVASGELRHQGARRISEGVWSTVDADGVPIPAATRDGSVVEAAATNKKLYSQDFANADWTKNVLSITATVTAPDGTSTGSTLTSTGAGNNFIGKTEATITNNATCTWSIFLKAGTATVVSLGEGSTVNGLAVFDLSAVTATVQNATSATIKAVGLAGWYRCTATRAIVGTSAGFKVYQGSTYPGASGTGTFSLWGAQLEESPFATEYIPTTTAAVTRNKDVLDDAVSGNLTAAAGSVAFQFTPTHAPSGTIALGGSYVDASNYTALLHDGTKYILRKRIAASNYDAELAAVFVSGTTYDISLRWGASGSNLAVDGVLGTANTTGIEGVQYGKLPGTAGAYFSTPDSSAFPLDDFEFVVACTPPTWSTDCDVCIKGTTLAGAKCIYIYFQAGTVAVFSSLDGTTVVGSTTGAAEKLQNRFSTGQKGYVKISRVASTGVITVSTSTDGVIFTAMGSTIAGPVGTLFNESGSLGLFGTDALASGVGDLYSFKIYNTIGGATPVVDFNPADYTNGTTWPSSATSEVWTINGNAAVWPAVKLGTRWQWGADGNGGQQAGACFKEKYLYTRALSDSELQAVTA